MEDNKKESKRSKRECTEEILSQAIKVLQKPNPDEFDIFGQYVAIELRGIQCEQIRRRAKREINLALLKAQDDDDQGQQQILQSSRVLWSSSTSSICFEGPGTSSQTKTYDNNNIQQSTLMPSFKHA